MVRHRYIRPQTMQNIGNTTGNICRSRVRHSLTPRGSEPAGVERAGLRGKRQAAGRWPRKIGVTF
jgi:hypothetical protein